MQLFPPSEKRALWARVVDYPFQVIAVLLISFYRYTLSALMGRTCRHAPSCSEFTRDAIWQHGFWAGGWMGLARIYRCGPRGTHGYDPVPKELNPEGKWYKPWLFGSWTQLQPDFDDEHKH